MSALFTEDFKPEPYWWEGAPRPPAAKATRDDPLPERVDIAVVGAGYTGLHASVASARAGATTLVLDAEAAGWGCSTRNGGQVSTSIKPAFETLTRRHGRERAQAILREGQASLDHIERFVTQEGIECDFAVCGRFHGAHTARRFEAMQRDCETGHPVLDTGAYVVPKAEMACELDTPHYHGGMVLPRHASLHPARYHAGLLAVAERAGVDIRAHCRVDKLERMNGGFRLHTSRGVVRADRVVLATNGYSGPLSPWHRRRVIPIGSYVIATEGLPADLMDEVMPTNRILSDTRKLVYYYRPSPDRTRIVFGGRVSLSETDPKKSAVKLQTELVRLFPQLAGVRVSHSWVGFVAYSFDELMHLGSEGGLYYAMGYCGSGVGMASYLGMRIGQQAVDQEAGRTAFDGLAFQTRPFYSGNPWFLAPSVLAYRIRDRLDL
ncbi:glycine/D-amino acid oxidase-like deaminating enzyme [Breoghania corrubedonensis]|uniref:Glycine/D-amino acid oxidase-like deaminating enzyme n=1 Tax=Breoghania corrubedonensis TaxID=665038 RepID=A0A2T5VGD8_9HYPH|nr:FAD-binding oxidoreductase [Breoghania corrubedonensis]PTW62798.1 glycine/D-amino acid oxidase-like deaminating enzyme [Breoghania corrubedonensis]